MFEENEISKNANGGTEIAKRKLASIIDPNLLDNFQIISSIVSPNKLHADFDRYWLLSTIYGTFTPKREQSFKERDSLSSLKLSGKYGYSCRTIAIPEHFPIHRVFEGE